MDIMAHETNPCGSIPTPLPRALACTLGRPYVVAVEGPNGSGKTLLCRLLSERMGLPHLRGIPAAWEHPAMKLHMIRDADWLASAMYFLSGVIESSREAARGQGEAKVMDRSVWSTVAAHYAFDPRRLELLLPLLELAAGRIKVPDLTIVLEISPETHRQRVARKAGDAHAFDTATPLGDAFLNRERDFYHWLAGQWPKVVFITTEHCEVETVYRQAQDFVREAIGC